jgi:hypothetical protein
MVDFSRNGPINYIDVSLIHETVADLVAGNAKGRRRE